MSSSSWVNNCWQMCPLCEDTSGLCPNLCTIAKTSIRHVFDTQSGVWIMWRDVLRILQIRSSLIPVQPRELFRPFELPLLLYISPNHLIYPVEQKQRKHSKARTDLRNTSETTIATIMIRDNGGILIEDNNSGSNGSGSTVTDDTSNTNGTTLNSSTMSENEDTAQNHYVVLINISSSTTDTLSSETNSNSNSSSNSSNSSNSNNYNESENRISPVSNNSHAERIAIEYADDDEEAESLETENDLLSLPLYVNRDTIATIAIHEQNARLDCLLRWIDGNLVTMCHKLVFRGINQATSILQALDMKNIKRQRPTSSSLSPEAPSLSLIGANATNIMSAEFPVANNSQTQSSILADDHSVSTWLPSLHTQWRRRHQVSSFTRRYQRTPQISYRPSFLILTSSTLVAHDLYILFADLNIDITVTLQSINRNRDQQNQVYVHSCYFSLHIDALSQAIFQAFQRKRQTRHMYRLSERDLRMITYLCTCFSM